MHSSFIVVMRLVGLKTTVQIRISMNKFFTDIAENMIRSKNEIGCTQYRKPNRRKNGRMNTNESWNIYV